MRRTRAGADFPHLFWAYLTSREHDVAALVFAAEMTDLSALLISIPPSIAHLARVRSHVGLAWSSDVHWRLGALSDTKEQNYEHGAIYYSGATGAHYVQGPILTHYLELGGPATLGFPTTDENSTLDGVGRYNHST